MNQSETDLGIVDESQLLRFGISPAGTRNYAENKFAAAKNSFIIFVDRIFTTLIEPLFTNVFDAIAPIAAFS